MTKCLKEWVTRVRGRLNDSIEIMMTIKDVQIGVLDVADVQLRVENDAGQKTWIPLKKGKQGQHTSLGFSMHGLQNACRQQ